ncbi:securin [Cololabis saira]|uniref:securin n=1 Tax=Cololabis saira TaxID=129043 RepID=UPI002AD3BDFF|nr:securin [Cololabis saira]
MADIFVEQENAHFQPPSLKLRQRLPSVPEKLLKSPMIGKSMNTPLRSGRKAFGMVNKNSSTPAVAPKEKRLLKPQETKVKQLPQTKVEEYPEIEKFIPYDPLEFERYSIPDDLVLFGGLALPGLACFSPPLCEEDLEKLDPLPELSPMKMPKHSVDCRDLNSFLQTLDELTIELPPEPFTDD